MEGDIRPGDLITAIDGETINNSEKLLQEVAALESGRNLPLRTDQERQIAQC